MELTYNQIETKKKNEAQQTALILGLVSSLMIFGGFTSAFLVRKASQGWVSFAVPDIFWTSTILIGLSSLTLFIAYHFFNKKNVALYRLFTFITLVLGAAFVWNQLQGWEVMNSQGISLTVASSGTFYYLITALHVLHVAVGLLFMVAMFFRSLFVVNKNSISSLVETHPTFKYRVRLFNIFWHSIGLLWIYLFFFVMLVK